MSFIPLGYLLLSIIDVLCGGLMGVPTYTCHIISVNDTLIDIANTYGRNARRDVFNEEFARFMEGIRNNHITQDQVKVKLAGAISRLDQGNYENSLTMEDGLVIKYISTVDPYSQNVAQKLSGLGNPDNINLNSNAIKLRMAEKSAIVSELRVKLNNRG